MLKNANIQVERIKRRSERMLRKMCTDIEKQKKELGITGYYRTYSKGELTSELGISRAIAEATLKTMQAEGIELSRDESKATRPYQLDLSDIASIYQYRNTQELRDRFGKALTAFITNLKGGVAKTVSTVSLAHGMRTHPRLLKENLRILVIDLDPQASATMFLRHNYAIGNVENTAVQAILRNLSREELLKDFILDTEVLGVHLLPASIDDGFTTDIWDELCSEHLEGIHPYEALKKCVIEKVEGDYDFIFLDTGPHLDSLLKQSLVAADLLITPIAPAQVDFHSSLKYLSRLPDIISSIESSGAKVSFAANIGMMTKLANKRDQQLAFGQAMEIFGGDMLPSTLPRLDAMERAGESFDTVITIPPQNYEGDRRALKRARDSVWEVSKALFERIEYIRSENMEG